MSFFEKLSDFWTDPEDDKLHNGIDDAEDMRATAWQPSSHLHSWKMHFFKGGFYCSGNALKMANFKVKGRN